MQRGGKQLGPIKDRPQWWSKLLNVLTAPEFLWPLLVAALFGIGWLLVTRTHDFPGSGMDRFLDQLGAAVLGAAVTASAAMVLAFVSFRRRGREARARRQLSITHQRSAASKSLRLGSMSIEDLIVVASSRPRQPYTDVVVFRFNALVSGSRPQTAWKETFSDRLAAIKQSAIERGVRFDDDPGVDLAAAGVERRGRVGAPTVYALTPQESSYYAWAATSNALDRPLSENERAAVAGQGSTLRERSPNGDPRRIEDVGALPWPAKVGVGTTIVTNDGMLVLGTRGQTFVASSFDTTYAPGRTPLHFVAEGMLPTDLNHTGAVDPEITARRGLAEELAVDDVPGNDIGRLDRLVPTGVFLDTMRWQPCFAYVAYLDTPFDQLSSAIASARDFWEMDSLIPFPFSTNDEGLRALMLNRHPHYQFASNHAAALAYFTLLNEFGFDEVRRFVR